MTNIYGQAQYASDILYMAALCLAKISILILLQRLAVSRLHKRIALATAGVTGLWALTGIIVLAAQCGSSLPWTTHKCIDIRGFWIGMTPVDVLTELVVVIVPIWMMVPVQVAISKKAVIVVAFAFRVPVICATIARLFYIHPATSSAKDATWNAVNYNIVTECVLCTSIMTACIPCLKPFLDGFESGMMGVSFKDRMPGGSNSGSRPYKMRDLAYGNTKSNNASMMRSQNNEKDTMQGDDNDPRHKLGVSVEVVADGNRDRNPGHNRGGDTGSVASSSKSDQMIIKKNIQWTVQYEDAPPPRNETNLSRRQSGARGHDKSDVDTLHDDAHQGDAKVAYAL